jgi:pimeloyl-ACP methyl ester carboxylesterase
MTDQLTPGEHRHIDGKKIYIRDTGGEGPVVLLAHGWPDDSTLWRHQQRDLAASGYRVLSFDWPAHGQSDTPRDIATYRIPRLGHDLVGVLDAVGVRRAHLVAHDYGATVSWEAVPRHQERFESFTAISVGHAAQIASDIVRGHAWNYHWLVLHGMRYMRRHYLADDARRFRRAFGSHPDGEKILERLSTNPDPFAFLVWERANPSTAVLARLARPSTPRRITVPTMAIYSRGDEWMTEGQLARSRRFVDGPWRYHSVAGGHWVQLQHPDVVTALLVDWLGTVAPNPGRALPDAG